MRSASPFALVLFAIAAPVVAQGGWVQRVPAHSPPPRAWHGLAFDTWRGVQVMFGGSGGIGNPLNDTWEWNGLDWTQSTPANAPPARYRHAMAHDFNRGRIVLHGGRVVASGVMVGDTWEYDGVNWAQRLPAQSPAARESAGMAFSFARGRVILFGGSQSISPAVLQDVWEWDGTNWTPLVTVNVPPARSMFGMTSDFPRGLVFVFGGRGTFSAYLSDAWSFDGVDWTQLPAAPIPPPLQDNTLTADLTRGVLLQFGGQTVLGPLSNQTWLHDGCSWRPDLRPIAMTPRRAVAFSYDWSRDVAVLFGGVDGNFVFFSETWEYSLAGAARCSRSGDGCAGTQGMVQLLPAGQQRAIIGTTCTLELVPNGGAPGGATSAALYGLGFSNTNWNGIPLPQSLAGFGMPGCVLHTSLEFVSFVASGAGAPLALTIPADPGLVGVRFFAQALVPQPGVNAAGAVMSNAVANVIGSF